MHHWSDRAQAFSEIKRVIHKRFVALTWDPQADPYWLTKDYFPDLHRTDQAIFPRLRELEQAFPNIKSYVLAIPRYCIDGFTAAYWARPEY